ncbi:hypothetical protein [Streptomyces calidiresistens]|uniref:Uncharacterized protein n=1 Tax=Streptomyces calidiresistens TaxID=1485586 RepID=A0A7W3XY20_9ACTN|nr:hypothetical protein [Streptomyces calidiresistens]MBB0231564.1 hypothetical protein [Streptomyces calidiresistens]
MAEHRRMSDRRPLLTGVVSAVVLCGVWLMPSAHAGPDVGDGGPGIGTVSESVEGPGTSAPRPPAD